MTSPYLRSDAAVARFLSESGDEAAWESAKKMTAVMDNAGVGHMRWLQRILCEHIAESPESEISTFRRHIEQRERLLTELASCAKRLSDKSSGSFEVRNDASLVGLLDKATATINSWSQVERFQPGIYELILLEKTKYLLHQATGMKQLLLKRERGMIAEASPDPTPAPTPEPSSGFSVASFTSAASSAASRLMNVVEPPLLSIEEQRRRGRHTSDLITRALVAEEMKRFRSETTKALEIIMDQLSCAEAQITKRAGAIWREYLKTSPADPQYQGAFRLGIEYAAIFRRRILMLCHDNIAVAA
ncbi:hypothetical protein PHYBOEH_006241 [Phytophthora boehmeriae]|uniref:Uncharacterized protein n=1 Tax=Phytophthora boehmeriae TaxID=109152 RepID=A0A8T1X3Y2_9STRA|nr:hypothetical protein PHYBOEH_006241 [Phytophthora boehmeriae]